MPDRDIIRSFFESAITKTTINYPVEYQNVQNDVELSEAKKGSGTWLRVTILDADAFAVSLKGVRRRYVGICNVGIFVVHNSGTKQSRNIADAVDKAVRDQAEVYRLADDKITIEIKNIKYKVVEKIEKFLHCSLDIEYNYDQVD